MQEEWEQDPDAAIEAILDEFEGARPMADLIQASTIEEYRQVAQEIDRKVRAMTPTQQPSDTSPRTPKSKTEAVSVKEAIDSRDWSGFLAAKWAEQNRG